MKIPLPPGPYIPLGLLQGALEPGCGLVLGPRTWTQARALPRPPLAHCMANQTRCLATVLLILPWPLPYRHVT